MVSNLIYFYGMCGVVKELLLKRYFSKVGQLLFLVTILFMVGSRIILDLCFEFVSWCRKFVAVLKYLSQI